MNYAPAIRDQSDSLGDEMSLMTGTLPGDEPDLTRQEFKDDADLNVLLSRFGVDTLSRANPQYGTEVDYNLDLQQALSAIEAARRANLQVPEQLRDKYPDWRAVLNGAETGQYQRDLQALADAQAEDQAQMKRALELDAEKTAIKRRQKAERDLEREREDLQDTKRTPKPGSAD